MSVCLCIFSKIVFSESIFSESVKRIIQAFASFILTNLVCQLQPDQQSCSWRSGDVFKISHHYSIVFIKTALLSTTKWSQSCVGQPKNVLIFWRSQPAKLIHLVRMKHLMHPLPFPSCQTCDHLTMRLSVGRCPLLDIHMWIPWIPLCVVHSSRGCNS